MNPKTESTPITSYKTPMEPFDYLLLSTPFPTYNIERLHDLVKWLMEALSSHRYRRYPSTIEKIKKKYNLFMELYERAKAKKRENKEKKFIPTNATFYRPRLGNRNDQRLFDRLDERRKASIHRKNDDI